MSHSHALADAKTQAACAKSTSSGRPRWPFNPNFPKAFSFPAFGTVEWLALACWDLLKGDAAKVLGAEKIKAGAKLKWRLVWGEICTCNDLAKRTRSIPGSWRDRRNYGLTKPGQWVETLLDVDKFWGDINGWALAQVEREFQILNPDGAHIFTYATVSDGVAQSESFCRRFHAWQQARYRYHEHLLEKHCDRALGKEVLTKARNFVPQAKGYIPKTAVEARASLIGLLSKQRGYATAPLVKEFRSAICAKKPLLTSGEKKAFSAERTYPSNHRYRATPDEMGWLILSWPIWNSCSWRWTDLAEAAIKKFRFVDAKGKPLDFLKTSRKRLQKALRANSDASGAMPSEKAFALFDKYLGHPTPKEQELHRDWEQTVKSRRSGSSFEELARSAIGERLERGLLPRPRGRGTGEKPPLWDFAQKISA